MLIRQARLNDIDGILDLFSGTVTNVCATDYHEDQVKVWAASAENKQKWVDRINKQYFLIAEKENKIVGFGSIENGDYLDMLYVHKDHLRQGIANKLLEELEKESERENKHSISSDVSITARPFFEKYGYKVVKEQRNIIHNVEVINYKMIKEKTL